MAKPYTEVALETGSEHFDMFVALMHGIGFDSFQEEGDVLRGYIQSAQWTDETRAAVDEISQQLLGKVIAVHAEVLEEKNWNEEWEKSLQPVEVSDRIAIVQRGKSYDNVAGRLLIEINPKMSFGTGYHETTRLMIRAIEKALTPDDAVLDIGTGTGVLAIACRLLGNHHPIVAFDNDEWSVDNAKENAADNGCTDIDVFLLDAHDDNAGLENLLKARQFSLILANVNLNSIERLMPQLASAPYPIRVLFSGVLKYDHDRLAALAGGYGLFIRSTTTEGEWLCALAEKP